MALTGTGSFTRAADGPDVIAGDINQVYRWGRYNGITGYSFGTVACNVGNAGLHWIGSSNLHPVIAQNLYRLKGGRFEQIGMAWLKHGFAALIGDTCGICQTGSSAGTILSPGCSDPYSAALNGDQTRLGPRSTVNASTGVFPYNSSISPPFGGNVSCPGTGENVVCKRLQVVDADLRPSLNVGALYFAECEYIMQDDAAAGNGANNNTYRQIFVTESPSNQFNLSFTNGTFISEAQRMRPAVAAWHDNDPNVMLNAVGAARDGWFWVASRVTALSGGMYHYEYAVENLSSDRSAGVFTVPIPSTALVANIGFHGIPYHSGEPFSSADWTPFRNATGLSWSTQAFAQNGSANALRFATAYNFRFDCNVPPAAASHATIGLFKPGTGPAAVFAAAAAPADSDCNANNIPDTQEIGTGLATDCDFNGLPDDCEITGRDCNTNGVLDRCEVDHDCNTNGTPDICEPPDSDCNSNGVPDICESPDCNTNGVRDVCELLTGDCDHNGVLDSCQADCNTNGQPDACENLPDCNSNGSPDICDLFFVPGGTLILSNSPPNLNIPVPDGATVTNSVTVPSSSASEITDVDVTVNIAHTYVADLLIRLSHGNTTVTLWNRLCDDRDNLNNVTFDDESLVSPNSCGALGAQISGPRRPVQALAGFKGPNTNAAGLWTLTVSDLYPPDPGTFINWTLTVTTKSVVARSADINHNQVPDECECVGCRGDMNADGLIDADDIQPWIGALFGAYRSCADINADGVLGPSDLTAFVSRLITTPGPCQ